MGKIVLVVFVLLVNNHHNFCFLTSKNDFRYKNATALAQKCPKIDSKHEKIRGVRKSGPKRQTVITG